MSWLDELFQSFKKVAVGGVLIAIPNQANGQPTQPTVLNLASNATAAYNAVTGQIDLTFNANPLSVTGTGFVRVVGGTVQSAADIGAQDTVLTVNHAGSDRAWIVPGPDISLSNGAWDVVGIRGVALPTLPVAAGNYAAVYNEAGNSFSWVNTSTFGGSVTWANDLSTSTNTNQYVSAISGGGGSGGTVTLGATVALTAAAGAGSADLSLWTGVFKLPTGNVSWAGATGQTMSLVGQSSVTITAGTSLNLSGNTGAYINAHGSTYLDAGNTGSQITAYVPAFAFIASVAPVISQLQSSSVGIATPNNLTIAAQQGQAVSSGTNNSGGNAIIKSGLAGTGGTGGGPGNIQLWTGSTNAFQVDSTTIANFSHLTTTLNGFYFNASVGFYVISPNIYFDGVLQIQNPGNGNPVWTWSDSDTAQATQTVAATTAGVLISQLTASSGATPQNFTVQPQAPNAGSTTAVTNTGGNFVVALAAPNTNTVTGLEAQLQITRNGSMVMGMGTLDGTNTYCAIWAQSNASTPNGNNWSFQGSSTATGFNAPASGGQMYWSINASAQLLLVSGAFSPFSAGGGVTLGTSANPFGNTFLASGSCQIITSGGVNPEILFTNPPGVSGAGNGVFLAFTAANTVGTGMSIAIIGQSAFTTGANNSGGVLIASGLLNSTGADGGITFGFNLNGTGGTLTDKVSFLGAATSAARGNLQWSNLITPQLSQQVLSANGNPANFTIATQSPANLTGASIANNTPGSFIVSIPAIGTATATGLHGSFQVWDSTTTANNIQFQVGNFASVTSGGGTVSAMWLGTGTTAFTPTNTNFSFENNGASGSLTMNHPNSLSFATGGTTWLTFNNTGWGGNQNQPSAFGFQTTNSVSAVSSFSLTSAQIATPVIQLTTAPTSGTTCTITLPSANAVYFFDIATISGSLNSTTSINFKSGTSAASISVGGSTPATTLVVVITRAGNNTPVVLWR